MIVRGADGVRRELFARFDSSTPIPSPSQWGYTLTDAGVRVDFKTAAGLPAFLRGIRLIGETAAGLPFVLSRGFGDERKPQPRAPQNGLLRRPNPDASSGHAMWRYVYTCLPGRGNAYLWKLKVRGALKFLYPVNPAFVTPSYDGDRVEFELRDREYGPVVKTVGKDQIIHIPGILLTDPYIGVSVVEAHRNSIGAELGRQRFEGRYLANDTQVGSVLKHPGNPSPEQRAEIRDGFEARHTGNPGRPAVMWGGWELDQLPISLQDAQFIESKRYSVQDMGRMLGIPSGFLNDPDAPGGASPEHENMRLLQHGAMPWRMMVEEALAADADLFPEPDWQVDADDQGFLKADIKTRYESYRLGRQGGWITPNEIRAREGYPAVANGDKIQETPVGGAPNSSSSQNTTTEGSGDDADA